MQWEFKYREVRPHVKEATALEAAGPVPHISGPLMLYFESFKRLDSERQVVQGGIGCIPVTKIIEYGHWIDIQDVDGFTEILQELDTYYVSLAYDSLKTKMKAG